MSLRFLLLALGFFVWMPPVFAAAPPSGPRLDIHGERLPEGAIARFGAPRLRAGYPRQFIFAPNGKYLALHSDGGNRVWNLATGKAVRPPDLDEQSGLLDFTPDGTPVLCDSSGVRILSPAGTVRIRVKPPRPEATPAEIAFSPDGKWLASAWHSLKDKDWKCLTLHELADADKATSPLWIGAVDDLCFSNDGTLLAGATGNRALLWNTPTRKLLGVYTAKDKPDAPVSAVRLSPDGKRLAVCQAGKIRLWRTDAVEEVSGAAAPTEEVVQLRFSADSKTLTGCRSSGVFRWSALTGKEQSRFPMPKESLHLLFKLSQDGELLALAERRNDLIHLWDVATGRECLPVEQLLPSVEEITFTDPSTIAAARKDGSVVFCSAKDGHVIREHKPPAKLNEYAHPRLSPGGDYLAINHDEGDKFAVYEVATGRELWRITQARGESIDYFTFSPDGKSLLLRKDSQLQLCNTRTGKILRQITDSEYGVLAFAPDGRTVASGDQEKISIFELSSGKVRQRLQAPPLPERRNGTPIEKIQFFRQGQHLASLRAEDLSVFSINTGKLIFHQPYLERKDVYLRVLAISPDGRWLVRASERDSAFHLQDLRSGVDGNNPPDLGGHIGGITDLVFSPDGKQFVSAGSDGTALVWDLETILAIRRIRSLSPTDLEALWAKLASANAEEAGQAMRELERFPDLAVPLLNTRLRPVKPWPSRGVIDQLITDLGAEDYAVRTRAMRELESLNDLADSALRLALAKKPALELTRRLEQLIQKLDNPEMNPERLRSFRAIEILEHIGSPEANAILERIAAGAADARLTLEARASLGRLRTSALRGTRR